MKRERIIEIVNETTNRPDAESAVTEMLAEVRFQGNEADVDDLSEPQKSDAKAWQLRKHFLMRGVDALSILELRDRLWQMADYERAYEHDDDPGQDPAGTRAIKDILVAVLDSALEKK